MFIKNLAKGLSRARTNLCLSSVRWFIATKTFMPTLQPNVVALKWAQVKDA